MSHRIALVTGGTGGIGTEVCKKLHTQGHTVIACHLPTEQKEAEQWQQQLATQGHDINIEPCDVTNFESVGKMAQQIQQKYGVVELLINGAGITRDKTLKNLDPQSWNAVIETNLTSVYNVTKYMLDGMLDNGYGRIVNISSINGQKGQFGQTNYSAAKAGIFGFTMSLAQEVASKGITVNAVSPGYVKTPMTELIPEDIRQQLIKSVPVGRIGLPEDISHAISFLCDEASSYITGANLPVNGGLFMG